MVAAPPSPTDVAHADPDAPVDPRIARSRAKLLAAATEILVDRGPQAVTVDAVADRSGVAKSTLYRHWPSRTALLVDVLRHNIPRMDEPDLTGGFDAALRHHLEHLTAQLGDPEWARMVPALFALMRQFPEVAELEAHDRDEKVATMRAVLDLGVAEGRLPAGLDPLTVTMTLVGPVLMCAIAGKPESIDEVARFTLERFLAGYPA